MDYRSTTNFAFFYYVSLKCRLVTKHVLRCHIIIYKRVINYDGNLNSYLQHNFNNNISTTSRAYARSYHSEQSLDNLKDQTPFYKDDFCQQFYPEGENR